MQQGKWGQRAAQRGSGVQLGLSPTLTGIWDLAFGVGCAKSVWSQEQLGEVLVKLNPEGGRRMRTQSHEATGGA